MQQSGSYTVEITDSNGSNATATAVNIVTGVHNLIEGDEVNVYPNPFHIGFWNVEVSS